MKFVFLYRGGNAPQEEQEKYMTAWGMWIGSLVQRGTQKSGLPVQQEGKVISSTGAEDYTSSDGDVNGYSEIEAASLDEAVEVAKGCPNLVYGGKVEVRQAQDMPNM